MKKKNYLLKALVFTALFAALTVLVLNFDVRPVGPENSEVGMAGINVLFSKIFDYSAKWQKTSDIFRFFVFLIAGCFAATGAYELFSGKSFASVKTSVIVLGFFYVFAAVLYFVSNKVAVNYRPVIVDTAKGLSVSFPSSHIFIAVFVCVSGIYVAKDFNTSQFAVLVYKIIFFTVMIAEIITRVLSGVHWITDCIGGIFLGLALAYYMCAVCKLCEAVKCLN